MKRILLSLITLSAVGATAFYATGAFFSDTETSVDNVFQAGAIDLKIDSEAHYAGLVCQFVDGEDIPEGYQDAGYYWILNAEETTRPDLEGKPCDLSWESTNLVDHTFFNYDDLKPGDTGENTISLLIDNNPAWVCAEITVTADDDVTCTDPENEEEEGACSETLGLFNGEISENLSLAWWADDGDNILQTDEVHSLFFQSGASLQDILDSVGGGNTLNLTLADSLTNFFDEANDGLPLEGEEDYWIGVAWCFGEMDIDEGTGEISCNGGPVDNKAQTDKLMANISFTAEQERNQPNFTCEDSFRQP